MQPNAEAQAIERARYILGTLIIDPNKFFEIQNSIRPFMFPIKSLQEVADVVWARLEDMRDIDPAILRAEVEHPELINELAHLYTNDLEEHAKFLRDQYTRQEMSKIFADAQNRLKQEEESNEVAFILTEKIETLTQALDADEQKVDEYHAALNALMNNSKGLTGIASGFTDLDDENTGLQTGSFYVIGGRPAHGKTLAMLQMALSAALQEKQAVFFSLEMTRKQLFQRFFCLLAEVDYTKVRKGETTPEEKKRVQEAMERLYDLPLHIIETRSLPDTRIETIAAKCYQMKARGRCDVAFLDYLQICGTTEKFHGRDEKIGHITSQCKRVALKCNIPFVAISILNREIEKRGFYQPKTSDLFGASAIEYDADFICFMVRPEKHQIMEDEDGMSLKNVTQCFVEKDREFGDRVPYKLDWKYYKGKLRPLAEYEKMKEAEGEDRPVQFHAMPKADIEEELPF